MVYQAGAELPEAAVVYLGVNIHNHNLLDENNNIVVNGKTYDSEDHSLVWAYKDSEGSPGLMIYSDNYKELIPLARKIPHYGKYGYLVFEHGQNIAKGNHESLDSPLIWYK